MMLAAIVLLQLQAATDDGKVRELLMDKQCSAVFNNGFATPIMQVTVTDVPLIIRAVCIRMMLAPVKTELDQLASGLDYSRYPVCSRPHIQAHSRDDDISVPHRLYGHSLEQAY